MSLLIYIYINIISLLFLIKLPSNISLIFFLIYFLNFLKENILIFNVILIKNFKSIIYYLLLLICYLNFKYFYTPQCVSATLWPPELMYGFNLIHPILFYFTIMLVIMGILSLKTFIKITTIDILVISMSSLTLGMYWGSINEGWGFFWTNDNIEFILIYLILFILYLLHFVKFELFNWVSTIFLSIFILYTVMLRLNIFNTVHSFFIDIKLNFFFFFNFSIILSFYLIFLLKLGRVVLIFYFTYLTYLFKFFKVLKLSFINLNKNFFNLFIHNFIFILFTTLNIFIYFNTVLSCYSITNINTTLFSNRFLTDFFNWFCDMNLLTFSNIRLNLNSLNFYSLFTFVGFFYFGFFYFGFFYFSFVYLISIVKIYVI